AGTAPVGGRRRGPPGQPRRLGAGQAARLAPRLQAAAGAAAVVLGAGRRRDAARAGRGRTLPDRLRGRQPRRPGRSRRAARRAGMLRLPTQDDLIVVLRRAEGVDNTAYLEKLLLARMLVRLGSLLLNEITREEIVGGMLLADVDHLNEVFRQLVGETRAGPVVA